MGSMGESKFDQVGGLHGGGQAGSGKRPLAMALGVHAPARIKRSRKRSCAADRLVTCQPCFAQAQHNSPHTTLFSQAAELVEKLREVCVTHEEPAVFNALLRTLHGRCGRLGAVAASGAASGGWQCAAVVRVAGVKC